MTENQEQVLASLPVFPSGGGEGWRNLCVGGLVRYPLTFSQRDLERLPKAKLTQDFQCEEGWVVPDQRWEGPRVADLLELAKPLPGAKYVAFSAGEFTVGLSLEEIAQGGAVLAQKLNGQALTGEHGGPCRLVVPGKTCYYSVKWVDRLQVLAEQPEETGKEIALGRIRWDVGSGGRLRLPQQ
jgi:DMSO/TMAO reductase YedYZ molybdopterin-dependent catalytic subunit